MADNTVEYETKTVCEGCGVEYDGSIGYKFVRKGNVDPKKGEWWCSKCPACKHNNEIPLKISSEYASVFFKGVRKGKARHPRATHRPIGTNLRRAKRDRWFEKPSDLEEKLAEERRIREQNDREEE